jgi:hypothetical protein
MDCDRCGGGTRGRRPIAGTIGRRLVRATCVCNVECRCSRTGPRHQRNQLESVIVGEVGGSHSRSAASVRLTRIEFDAGRRGHEPTCRNHRP